jgi:hypothetical protein
VLVRLEQQEMLHRVYLKLSLEQPGELLVTEEQAVGVVLEAAGAAGDSEIDKALPKAMVHHVIRVVTAVLILHAEVSLGLGEMEEVQEVVTGQGLVDPGAMHPLT